MDAVIVGCGNIGLATALLLRELSLEPSLIDVDCRKLSYLSREYGFKTYCINVLSSSGKELLRKLSKEVTTCVTALPSKVGFEGVKTVIKAGFKYVVDVSYMREDQFLLNELAIKRGSTVLVDAGLAPGLSNLLVGNSYLRILNEGSEVKEVAIYVGGLAKDPKCPLGLAKTWNVRDLLDEYVRPARVVINGSVKYVDPLSMVGEVEVPKVGTFEYFVSDGLRTMIKSLKPPKELMAEYTLRYSGHLRVMKLLKELGLLNEEPIKVGNTEVAPIDVTTGLLSKLLSKCVEDRVVMYVKVLSTDSMNLQYLLDVSFDSRRGLTAMSLTTSGTQASVTKALINDELEGVKEGIHGLEDVGLMGGLSKVLKYLSRLGVSIEELK